MGAGILPTTIHNGKLFFLFGKEGKYEDSAPGFSDFGGGTDNSESFLETAIREAGEEFTGFLGNDSDVRNLLKKYGTYSPEKLKSTMKVSGVTADESGYISSDLKPSQVGIEGTMPIYADGGIIEEIKTKYERVGYKIPNLVFWNVNASGRNLPAREDEPNVSLVSGFSPSIFKMAVENKTPLEVMEDTINGERYNKIIIN
jgi:hypothetical protein